MPNIKVNISDEKKYAFFHRIALGAWKGINGEREKDVLEYIAVFLRQSQWWAGHSFSFFSKGNIVVFQLSLVPFSEETAKQLTKTQQTSKVDLEFLENKESLRYLDKNAGIQDAIRAYMRKGNKTWFFGEVPLPRRDKDAFVGALILAASLVPEGETVFYKTKKQELSSLQQSLEESAADFGITDKIPE